VTGADDVVQLLGRIGAAPLWDQAAGDGGVQPAPSGQAPAPGPARAPDVRAVEHLGGDAVRVWHALDGGRGRRVDELVVAVGVGHRGVSTALAMLELEGVVQRDGERWRRGAAGPRR
jgi:predicted Rossmann fold nucleotide-binding protein DprA/Smf involved in DNA uptake